MLPVCARSVAAGVVLDLTPRCGFLGLRHAEPSGKILYILFIHVDINMDIQDAQDWQDVTPLHTKLTRAMIRNRLAQAHDKI